VTVELNALAADTENTLAEVRKVVAGEE